MTALSRPGSDRARLPARLHRWRHPRPAPLHLLHQEARGACACCSRRQSASRAARTNTRRGRAVQQALARLVHAHRPLHGQALGQKRPARQSGRDGLRIAGPSSAHRSSARLFEAFGQAEELEVGVVETHGRRWKQKRGECRARRPANQTVRHGRTHRSRSDPFTRVAELGSLRSGLRGQSPARCHPGRAGSWDRSAP